MDNALNEKQHSNRRMPWCSNCGHQGHTSRGCGEPITSCGLILFERKSIGPRSRSAPVSLDKRNIECLGLNKSPVLIRNKDKCDIRFLLVRRRDSLDYVEFVRGKYDHEDVRYIHHVFAGITTDERQKLASQPFTELWTGLWQKSSAISLCCGADFRMAAKKFTRIVEGYRTEAGLFISLKTLLQNTQARYTVPEWGIPKGKRNKRESDLECARREFREETGCMDDDYAVIHQIDSLKEVFKGSNHILYKHVYFVGRSLGRHTFSLDPRNQEQMTEIGDIGWFTAKEALTKFRPYDIEKKVLLLRLDNILKSYRFSEEEVAIL